MDLTSLKAVSDKIYLCDMSLDFALLEGEAQLDDRAWVTVRIANEADNIRRAELLGRRDVKYLQPGSEVTMAETIFDNPRTRAKMEVYWTLEDFGNLTLNGIDLFPLKPIRSIPLTDFERIWHVLPMDVATAIYGAVLNVNRAWVGD
jgi:hypothetical protein